jgi:hypothetical protein
MAFIVEYFVKDGFERVWREVVVCFKLIIKQLPGESEENHEKPWPG